MQLYRVSEVGETDFLTHRWWETQVDRRFLDGNLVLYESRAWEVSESCRLLNKKGDRLLAKLGKNQ